MNDRIHIVIDRNGLGTHARYARFLDFGDGAAIAFNGTRKSARGRRGPSYRK